MNLVELTKNIQTACDRGLKPKRVIVSRDDFTSLVAEIEQKMALYYSEPPAHLGLAPVVFMNVELIPQDRAEFRLPLGQISGEVREA